MSQVVVPSNTKLPGLAAARALLIVVASAEVFAQVTVEPLCILVGGVHGFGVVSPSENIACRPACVQSMARLGERIPDHGCADAATGSNSERPNGITPNTRDLITPAIQAAFNLDETCPSESFNFPNLIILVTLTRSKPRTPPVDFRITAENSLRILPGVQ
jgi:hypothetical protein